MAARQTQYAESTGESTTTSTSYQDKTTLTFTPDDNSTYFIFGSWLHTSSSTARQVIANMLRTSGTPVTFNELNERNYHTAEYRSGFSLGVDAFGASPGSQTYKIQYKSDNAAGTAKIKEAKLLALKMDAADQYAESLSRSTSTSTNYTDKTTLTFTPATTGDYLIFAEAQLDTSSNNRYAIVTLDIDGTEYSTQQLAMRDTTNKAYFGAIIKKSLSNASHTIKIKWKISASSTIGIANARIIALRADAFANVYYGENDSRTTTTSTTYQDKTTLTQTPTALEHIIFGNIVHDSADVTNGTGAFGRLIEGATVLAEQSHRNHFDSANKFPYTALYRKTLAASSTTWKTQTHSETSGQTSGAAYSRILIIQTGDNVTTTKTITGISRITASVTKTITGLARVIATTTRTITGIARIQKSVTQTITGLARLQKSVTATIDGIARITASTLQTITGKARITASTSQTITGLARILQTVTQTITGQSRIQQVVSQTITGVANIFSGNVEQNQTIDGIARIQKAVSATITGLGRITASTTRTILGISTIQNTTTRTINGLARIQQAVSATIDGIARITASTSRTITGIGNILGTTAQTITGKARVTASTLQTIVGKARITVSVTQTITGIANIIRSKVYTREANASLPTDNADLSTNYSDPEIDDVALEDSVFVEIEGSGFVLHQFKDLHTNNVDNIKGTWIGKTSLAASDSTVYLQIYNYDTEAWETVDSDSSAGVDTPFTLTAVVTANLADYYGVNYEVSWRVYQEG